MPSYRERVSEDLDRWIAGGLVDADKRGAILATLPETRRVDAATALAWIGGVLLGVAAVAFVSANWDAIPRLGRFVLLLAVFAAAAGAGAWAAQLKRPILSNIALTVAALIFAAAIGLTGQIFDIAGDPKTACYIAGVAGFALAIAGRSTGAAAVALALITYADFSEGWFLRSGSEPAPWLIGAAPLGAYLALRWQSGALAHLSALGLIFTFVWFASHNQAEAPLLYFFTIGLAAMAAGARRLFGQGRAFASVFYGWFTAGALLFFISAGYVAGQRLGGPDLLHRIVWLAGAGGIVALGRFDRHAMVSTVGVLGMIGAVVALMNDLGLELMTAAGVFALCAIIAIAAGLMLRRKPKAS